MEYCFLSDICGYAKGKTEVSTLDIDNYISTENMLPNKAGVTQATSLPTISLTQSFQNNDVLVSNIRPYFKKIWFATTQGGCSNDVLVFRTKEGNDPRFLYYILADDKFFDYSMATSKGTKMPRGDKTSIMQYKVPLISLETQKRIAALLDRIDSKIENNSAINKNLEDQASALFNKLKNNSVKVSSLGDFIRIKHGYAFKGDYISVEDNNVVLVTPGNFRIGGGFKENKCKFFTSDYPQDYVLQAGSLIVTMTDLSKEADTLGFSAIVPYSEERIYLHNQRIGLVEPINSDLPLSYIYWYMRSYEYHMNIVGSASGSTVKHTSPGRILEQQIPIPNEKELLECGDVFDEINNIILNNNAEILKLQSLRNLLLPKLMSGEIDVSEIRI